MMVVLNNVSDFETLIKFHGSRDIYFFLLSAVAVSNFKEADKQM